MDLKYPETVTVVDGYTLANPFERIIAFMIDMLIAVTLSILSYVVLWFVGLGWLGSTLAVLYLIFRDSLKLMNYQSIGKKIMKLKVIDNHEKFKVTFLNSFKRNFIFLPNLLYAFGGDVFFAAGAITFVLLIIELYLLYTSTDYQRLGDQFAETLVIEKSI